MKGLSFSAPMVKAWLEGRKSITRRLMNPQPDIPNIKPEYIDRPKEWRKQAYLGPQHMSYNPNMWCLFNVGDSYNAVPYLGRKPRYLPGETVYIRETWVECDIKANDDDSESIFIVYKATNDMRPDGVSCEDFGSGRWVIRPEEEIDKFRHNIERMEVSGTKWRPPRFMPEWASRSHALIVSVRPEQLTGMTGVEARLEGFESLDEFMELWAKLHGEYNYKSWVWRIELKKV